MGNSRDKPLTSTTNQKYFYGGSTSAGLDQFGNKPQVSYPVLPSQEAVKPPSNPNYRVIGAPKAEHSGHFFGGSTKAGQGFGKCEHGQQSQRPTNAKNEKKYFFGGSQNAGSGFGKSSRPAVKKNHL